MRKKLRLWFLFCFTKPCSSSNKTINVRKVHISAMLGRKCKHEIVFIRFQLWLKFARFWVKYLYKAKTKVFYGKLKGKIWNVSWRKLENCWIIFSRFHFYQPRYWIFKRKCLKKTAQPSIGRVATESETENRFSTTVSWIKTVTKFYFNFQLRNFPSIYIFSIIINYSEY